MARNGVATAVVVIAGAVLAGLLWFGRTPSDSERTPSIAQLQNEADCNAALATCTATGEGVQLKLSLGPPVTAMQAFPIRLEVVADQALSGSAEVTLDFAMVGMDMGQNRYRLEREGESAWTGQALLPVCASGRRDWVARVTVSAGGRVWSAEFPFSTQAH